MPTVAISGGFDPIHNGHIDLIEKAAECGDVIVILNSDEWLLRKKKYYFLNFEQRAKIISSMRAVKSVTHVDDSDGTVCEALQRIKPTYFANGGDRTNQNTPELILCLDLGIKPIFNIGGGKVESSSELVNRITPTVIKPWGSYKILGEGYGWKTKSLTISPMQRLSLQAHKYREEHWLVVSGVATIKLGDKEFDAGPGETILIPAGASHRISNTATDEVLIIETQLGSYLEEDDIIRYEDDYGRAP